MGERRNDQPIPVEVQNNNFLDVTVYAVAAAGTIHLGEVTGHTTSHLSIDPRIVSPSSGIQLLVDPVGSQRNFLSKVLLLDRASSVLVLVAAELEMSYTIIR